MKKIIKILILLIFVLVQNISFSQGSLNSPYKCISNHLNHLNQPDYNPKKAIKSFVTGKDTSKVIEIAIKLKKIYDGMGLYVPVEKIPDKPDYIDSTTNKHRYVIFPERLPQIYVEKIDSAWYYPPAIYGSIENIYKDVYPFGDEIFKNLFASFGQNKFLGLYIWQYLGFLIIIVIALILHILLNKSFKPVISFIADKAFKTHLELPKKYNKTARILSFILIFFLLKYAFALLELPIKISAFLITTVDIFNIVFLGILAYHILDIFISFLASIAQKTSSKMDDQFLPILRQLIKILIITFVVIKILILLNINVTALIAGVSIGGLALALAAQDTVKNLIGSLMIFIDKPFQVDDWVEIDNMAGTVIEVGFRSTRIKQLDTSIISIPNGIISNKALTNKGLRVFRLFETTLGVAYDTPRLYLETFIEGLRKIAIKHEFISDDYYIYLKNLGDYSINILFRVYLKTNEYQKELALKEEITFLIMELAESINVRFAFPSQTLYVEQFPGKEDLIPKYDDSEESLHDKLKGFLDKL